ncbi:hypothetical protein JTE90_011410 [Oedothorax gibbosus]|uniref:Uncharacterized protein n=1 Tax=Oedothorax gibbosus TaxID=931172 RepID=A0AAV6TEB5_9ARAC|nr:hypothetical protein JTE90_011410 [Oedothorax gibbosus]
MTHVQLRSHGTLSPASAPKGLIEYLLYHKICTGGGSRGAHARHLKSRHRDPPTHGRKPPGGSSAVGAPASSLSKKGPPGTYPVSSRPFSQQGGLSPPLKFEEKVEMFWPPRPLIIAYQRENLMRPAIPRKIWRGTRIDGSISLTPLDPTEIDLPSEPLGLHQVSSGFPVGHSSPLLGPNVWLNPPLPQRGKRGSPSPPPRGNGDPNGPTSAGPYFISPPGFFQDPLTRAQLDPWSV